MRCTICGKEFGNGTHCQNCGTDRVQGLASYSGFSPSDNPNNVSVLGRESILNNENLAVCFACGEIISVKSEYCPKCGQKLKEQCPKCGNIYSAKYEYCDVCGTNRVAYLKRLQQQQEERRKQEEAERRRKEEEQLEQKQKSEAEEFRDKIRLSKVTIILLIIFCISLLSFFIDFGFGWKIMLRLLPLYQQWSYPFWV